MLVYLFTCVSVGGVVVVVCVYAHMCLGAGVFTDMKCLYEGQRLSSGVVFYFSPSYFERWSLPEFAV